MQRRRPGTWDVGISYPEAREKILKFIKEQKKKGTKTSGLKIAKALVLLIMLRNGSRISEAIEAAKKFVSEGKREVYVRVAKRKDNAQRLMILPEEATEEMMKELGKYVDKMYPELLAMFARKNLGINTHTLRHAFSTYMVLDMGIAPEIVSRLQGRKDARSLYEYMQENRAEDVLRMAGELAKAAKRAQR